MERARILFFADHLAVTVEEFNRPGAIDSIPCKSWSLDNDALNVSDSLSFTIDNAEGRNRGKINAGSLIAFDLSDDAVAGGQWTRQFTGRVIKTTYTSGDGSGSEINIAAMDLGWHLTTCDAPPQLRTENRTLGALIRKLIDPSWGFPAKILSEGPVEGNEANRALSQGRAGIVRSFQQEQTRGVLPYFQVNPGEKPWQTLQEYCARAGVLLGVGLDGSVILFRPNYNQDVPYSGVEYHPISDARSIRNNIIGRVTLDEDASGLYSESQCWYTVVLPNRVQKAETAVENNPNAMSRHQTFTLPENPLPYFRRSCFTDSEAIDENTARNRAIWRFQMDLFNSWSYTVTLQGHQQNGTFFTTDTMLPVHDSINGVDDLLYVQKCRKSMNEGEGSMTQFVLRLPVINPALTTIPYGGGQRKKAAPAQPGTQPGPALLSLDAVNLFVRSATKSQ